MKNSFEENLIKENVSTPSEKSGGVELSGTPQLDEVKQGLNNLDKAINHDTAIDLEDLNRVGSSLEEVKVVIGGSEMTVEEAQKIPDLKENMKLWEEMKTGEIKSAVERMTYITPGVAEFLSKKYNELNFYNLLTLSDEAAKYLGNHVGPVLKFTKVEEISDVAAECLSKHKGFLYLDRLISLSDTAAESLSKSTVRILSFKSLRSLSPAAAQALSKYKGGLDGGSLDLSGLHSIDDAVAEQLSRAEVSLDLSHISSLSDTSAEFFAQHKKDLDLSGLKTISEVVAEHLSHHKGFRLMLNGVVSISDTAAENLGKHENSLYLNGLNGISDKVVEGLSKNRGYLSLDGLSSISDNAAKYLSKHYGGLGLLSLKKISKKAATTLLSMYSGTIYCGEAIRKKAHTSSLRKK
jgi:hypothetical protein